MDQKDLELLSLLLENGRMSYEKISKKVNLTPNTVKNRINKLVQIGAIKKFSTNLLPKLFNLSICYSLAYLSDTNKIELMQNIGGLEEVIAGTVMIDNKISIVHLFKDESQLHANIQRFKKYEEIVKLENFILLMPYDIKFEPKITKNDWRIINSLKENCRKSDLEIAEELNLSTKTIRRRISHLRNNGIIYFMIDIDTSSGDLLTYNPIIRFKKITSKLLIQVRKIMKDIFYAWRIANEETMLYTVYINHLRDIDEQIKKIKQIEDITEIIKLIPTNMYYFYSLYDKIIEEKSNI